jgi:trans-2,3-dihydro-3-hydroxyanthranilate isomerase
MKTLRYHRVDVFTDKPFGGNPLAVFPAADGLADREMQQIAREMNLSETVFCLAPTADDAVVRLRIFTVDRELPLAGHPVVGTHFVLAATGRYRLDRPSITVRGQLRAGVLPVEILSEGGRVTHVLMTQRMPSFAPVFAHRDLVAAALGIEERQIGPGDLPIRMVDTGVPWLMVPLVDLRTIRALAPNPALCSQVAELAGTDMIYAFTSETESAACAAHARHVWFGRVTPGEDPVTGSAAGCLASYLVHESVLLAAPAAEVRIEQGVEVGRPGEVHAMVDTEAHVIRRVRVGGSAVHLGDGEIRF